MGAAESLALSQKARHQVRNLTQLGDDMDTTMLISLLLAIIGFVGSLTVKQLMNIAKAVNEIKTELKVLLSNHEHLEKRVDKLEDRIE